MGVLGCGALLTGPVSDTRGEPFYRLSGGTTTGPLQVTRIELMFPNDRGEITVPLNSRLQAVATIRFNGNGLFRAVWIIDGRELETVAVNVTFGDTLILRMREGTLLPTFEPGPHRVTLNIREPSPAFKVPEITYFVVMK